LLEKRKRQNSAEEKITASAIEELVIRSMLFTKINDDLKEAMKGHDSFRVGVLRFILSQIKNLSIMKYPPGSEGELTDEDIISVLSKSVKTHKESIEMFAKGKREDLVIKEEKELVILKSYLPEEKSYADIKKVVLEILQKPAVSRETKDFGKVMGMVMAEIKGQADGGMVSKIVREVINGDKAKSDS